MQMNVAMRTTMVFPDMLVQMVMIGEQAGSLDDMLNKLANIYQAQVDDAVDGLSSLLEPMIMVILGLAYSNWKRRMRIRTYGVVRGVMLKHPPTRFLVVLWNSFTLSTISTRGCFIFTSGY